jgi:hypothetical protein
MMNAETRRVEALIADATTIWASKEQMVKKTVSQASFSRPVDCLATAKGASVGVLVMRRFVHWKITSRVTDVTAAHGLNGSGIGDWLCELPIDRERDAALPNFIYLRLLVSCDRR